MNSYTCLGCLVADSEVRYSADGGAILSFRIANDVGFGDKKHTNWIRCFIFGKIAEGWLKDSLKKGVQVVVIGQLVIKTNEKDGKTYQDNSMKITGYDNIHVIANKQENKPQAVSASDDFGDLIPF